MIPTTLEQSRELRDQGALPYVVTFGDPVHPDSYAVYAEGYDGVCEPGMPDKLGEALQAVLGDAWNVYFVQLGSPFPGHHPRRLEIKSVTPGRSRDDEAVLVAVHQVFGSLHG